MGAVSEVASSGAGCVLVMISSSPGQRLQDDSQFRAVPAAGSLTVDTNWRKGDFKPKKIGV